MNKLNELQGVKLTDEQAATVKEMIIASMKSVYTSEGSLPGVDFEKSSNFIADKIIHNAQKALIQNAVYAKAARNSAANVTKKSPVKIKKVVKKVSIKKHVRK